jgi:4Fe-4S ferredoxin
MAKRIEPAERIKELAARADRPGEQCKSPAGRWVPRVDRAKCEGKSDCVQVCPYNVFEVRRIDDADFAQLGFFAKLKSRAHGRNTAYTPGEERCQACGLCVLACPEKAIELTRRPLRRDVS